VKRVAVEAFFPELKGNAYRTAQGTGSSPKVAISRAFSALLKQTRKKRITTIKATISIFDVIPQQEEQPVNEDLA
jgi:hypothetical protein